MGAGQNISVVIIDDQLAIAVCLSERLQQYGIEPVGTAQNANAGVAMVLDRQPTVVLLDIHMPGRDAFSACREITDRTKAKVLFYTGFVRPSYLDRAQQAGAAGLACKSQQTVEELVAAIRRVAAGDTYWSAEWESRACEIAAGASPLPAARLTDYEVEVIDALSEGKTLAEMASEFEVTSSAVSHALANARQKLACRTNAELIVASVRHGVIFPELPLVAT